MRRLEKTPKFWMTVKMSREYFETFKDLLTFDEPIPPFNTRYEGKLEGILGSTSQTFEGKRLNKTVLDTAAAYLNQLIHGNIIYSHIPLKPRDRFHDLV